MAYIDRSVVARSNASAPRSTCRSQSCIGQRRVGWASAGRRVFGGFERGKNSTAFLNVGRGFRPTKRQPPPSSTFHRDIEAGSGDHGAVEKPLAYFAAALIPAATATMYRAVARHGDTGPQQQLGADPSKRNLQPEPRSVIGQTDGLVAACRTFEGNGSPSRGPRLARRGCSAEPDRAGNFDPTRNDARAACRQPNSALLMDTGWGWSLA